MTSLTFAELNQLIPSHEIPITINKTIDHDLSKWKQFIAFLDANQDRLPDTQELLRTYGNFIQRLPNSYKAAIFGKNPDKRIEQEYNDVINKVHQSYRHFGDLLPDLDTPALHWADQERHLTHAELKNFVTNFTLSLPLGPNGEKPLVATAIINGPVLAIAALSVTSKYLGAPVTLLGGLGQLTAELKLAGAKYLLTTPDVYRSYGLVELESQDYKIFIMEIKAGTPARMTVTDTAGNEIPQDGSGTPPNRGTDKAMLLFTSGTSGKKKRVVLTSHMLIYGAIQVQDSWGLTADDICLNMMPLSHVGGLVRNIFAPLMKGGSTVCCQAFEVDSFWRIVERLRPTWYYAAPVIHDQTIRNCNDKSLYKKANFRLICNAAGALVHSQAVMIRDTYAHNNCVILPSYGMTECMPISTPPMNYRLEHPGTSGITVGVDLCILDGSTWKPVPTGTQGQICVRGDPVFPGYYKDNGQFDRSCFTEDGWFDTGDIGYIDNKGYLYINGRSKEVINRGGEIISPFEIEDIIGSIAKNPTSSLHGRVSNVMAFSATHKDLQEVVGVVLVTPPGAARVDLNMLHHALNSHLQPAKLPFVIVYMDDLPKNNNKVLRIKFAQRLNMPEFGNDTLYLQRHWEGICPPPNHPLATPIEGKPCSVDTHTVTEKILNLCAGLPIDVWTHIDTERGAISSIIAPASPLSPSTCNSSTSTLNGLRSNTAVSTAVNSDRSDSEDDKIPSPLTKNSKLTRNSPGYFDQTSIKHIQRSLSNLLVTSMHGYLVPQDMHSLDSPFPRRQNSDLDEERILMMVGHIKKRREARLALTLDGRIIAIICALMNISTESVKPDTVLCNMGINSMVIGTLAAKLRDEFQVPIKSAVIYDGATPASLASYIQEQLNGGDDPVMALPHAALPDSGKQHSSTNPLLMFIQLLPLSLVYPCRRGIQWTIFLIIMSVSEGWPTASYVYGRLFNLVIAITISKIIMQVICPIIGITTKWVLIGHYKEGLYPMWGWYHTRWWLTQKIIIVMGCGMFSHTNTMICLYYRLMGAKIGKNVVFKRTVLQEFDLIEIGDNVILEKTHVRPFGAEHNTNMYLGKIKIGNNCSSGTGSFIAPGSVIPDNTHIGCSSSSYELYDDEGQNYIGLVSHTPGVHWILVPVVLALRFGSWFMYLVPWLAALVGLVMEPPEKQPGWGVIFVIIHWFAAPNRVGWHFLAMFGRIVCSPMFVLAYGIIIHQIMDLMFGKMKPSLVENRSNVDKFRMAVMREVAPMKNVLEVTSMLGGHYETTSCIMRLLGAKIGKRVYWPGTGPSMTDYPFIEIGDDVVFGSRSHFITSDGIGSGYIRISAGSMIADRCVLKPGVIVGKGTVLGSGATTIRDGIYYNGLTYANSRNGNCEAMNKEAERIAASKSVLHKSTSQDLMHLTPTDIEYLEDKKNEKVETTIRANSKESSSRNSSSNSSVNENERSQRIIDVGPRTPFGRAFYEKQAPYYVWPEFFCAFYSVFFTIISRFLWNLPTVATLQIANRIYDERGDWRFRDGHFHLPIMLSLMCGCTCVLIGSGAIIVTLVMIAGKWIIMGRRTPGNYDWDKKNYCQRWQLYLGFERLRRQCIHGHGVLGLLSGTHYVVMYFRALGAKIGKDCALFAGGTPELYFTEPDLLTIGDRVTVDDASLVGHINSRGKFDLNPLSVGDRAVLRAGSRLLSGSHMREDSCLLEHTLVLGGEIIDKGITMQGWSGEFFKKERVPYELWVQNIRNTNEQEQIVAACEKQRYFWSTEPKIQEKAKNSSSFSSTFCGVLTPERRV